MLFHSDGNPSLLGLLERLQLGLGRNDQILVFAKTRTARDQVSADDVLLQILQRIDLGLDGCLVERLGGLLERGRRDEARGLQGGAGNTLQHLRRGCRNNVAYLHGAQITTLEARICVAQFAQ